jgi:alpha-tubulin suppressor-like RCC1 family protein
MRRVCAGEHIAFAVGDEGQFFSWGSGEYGRLGHSDTQDQPSPKRVEALRGVRMSIASVWNFSAVALAEDGLMYAWGHNMGQAQLSAEDVEGDLQPKPIEALHGVRVGSVAIGCNGTYVVADTGELWGRLGCGDSAPFCQGNWVKCLLPEPSESLRGVKVDAVAGDGSRTMALADDWSVYMWGVGRAASFCELGPAGRSVKGTMRVTTPRHIPGLRVSCGL